MGVRVAKRKKNSVEKLGKERRAKRTPLVDGSLPRRPCDVTRTLLAPFRDVSSMGFNGFQWVAVALLGFTGFDSVPTSWNEFQWVQVSFHKVLLGSAWFQ